MMRTVYGIVAMVCVLIMLGVSGCGRDGKESEAGESTAAAETADTTGDEDTAGGTTETASTGDAEETGAPEEPEVLPISYARDIKPIFEAKCVYCHHPDNAVKVDLTRPFDPDLGIINRKNSWTRSEKKTLVVPGDPEASALVLKVEERNLDPKVDGDFMPWAIPRLTDAELDALAGWINAGANDDDVFRSRIVRIFGDGVSLGSRGGKCSYCHYPGADFGPDLTNVFDPQTGAVDVASDRGGTRIVPGDAEASVVYVRSHPELMPPGLAPLMPWHIEPLTEAEQQAIRDWIEAGALNN